MLQFTLTIKSRLLLSNLTQNLCQIITIQNLSFSTFPVSPVQWWKPFFKDRLCEGGLSVLKLNFESQLNPILPGKDYFTYVTIFSCLVWNIRDEIVFMCVDVDSRLSGIFFFLMYMYCIFTNVVLDMLDTFFKNYIEENPENLVSFSAPISKLENDTVNKHLGHHLIT